MDQPISNPLSKHFRQPALYIKLPSNGAFWPDGTLDLPMNNEIPVLPMSTMDEIILRTPDALINGQGVVNVIQSCCPSIKDAWAMPSIDVDSAIIAIRIASYGNQMDVSATCPHCKTTNDYAIDLSAVLQSVTAPNYAKKLVINDLSFKLKPQAYFSVNKSNMIEFEEKQILRTISAADGNPDDVKRIFNEQLEKIVELNIELLSGSTAYIELTDGTIVSSPSYINEFYRNCDASIIKQVKAQLEEHSRIGNLKPISVMCEHEECQKPFDVSITFDFASFFANGS